MKGYQPIALRTPAMRTTATVQDTLISTHPNHRRLTGNPYLDCRFTPFALNQQRTGPPDGLGKRLLMRDWKSAYTITAESLFTLRISPTYPYNVRLWSANNVAVNGTALNAALAISLYGANLDPGAMSSDFPGAAVLNTNLVASARIVSVGYRLFYVGTATAAEGLIIVDDVGTKIDIVSRGIPNTVNWIQTNGGANAYGAQGVEVAFVDDSALNSPPIPTTYQYVGRPENGVEGVLRGAGSAAYGKFQPWYETGIVPVSDVSLPNTVTLATFNQALSNIQPAITVYDDQFMMANVTVTNGGAFRLEVATCMEWELQPNNAMTDMTKPSPMRDQAVLELADAFDSMVVARPYGSPPVLPPLAQRPRFRRPNPPKPNNQQQQKPTNGKKKRRNRRRRARRRARARQNGT